MRIAVLVIDVHRSTQHDQSAIAVDVGLRIRMALEIMEPDAVAPCADARVQRAQGLGGDMLEDHQSGHITQQ